MILPVSLAIAALAGAVVSASPVDSRVKPVILPVRQVTNVKSIRNIVEKGQSRIKKINNPSNAKDFSNDEVSSGAVTNEDVSYVASVDIGGSTWELIVDTGCTWAPLTFPSPSDVSAFPPSSSLMHEYYVASNTWCGAQSSCEPTSTGSYTGGYVEVSYGSGSFEGYEYTDDVSFGGLTVSSQSIGAAFESSGFSSVDGIIGFGPVDLTEDTVSNANEVPTFMDNLYSQGTIQTEVLGVSFRPEPGSDTDDTNGELTLGGTDSSKYSGSIAYFPKLTSGTASAYWGISISSFSYGSTELSSGASGIVDTGTTLIYIPSDAYNNFLSATGGETDSSSGLASFSTKPTSDFKIKFGSTTFSLTPSQYLIPSAQYSYFGLDSGKYYAWINNGGSSGVDTIVGQKFLENYYAVFDTTNSRIGFAAAS